MTQESIIIFHRIPYSKILYHTLIDHRKYNIYYLILSDDDIPSNIECGKVFVGSNTVISDVVHLVYSQNINLRQIVALSEYDLLEASILRDVLNIATTESVKDTAGYRDKLVMKSLIQGSGIKTAEFLQLSKLKEGFSSRWEKIILKPTNGAASNNIDLYSNESDLIAKNIRNPDFYIVEEYISGDILHFDGLVHDGNILFSITSSYINNCLDFAKKYTPLASYQKKSDKNIEWVKKCLLSLNMFNGPFHIEAILSKEELYFLEAANRAGGANVVKCTEYRTGVNLMHEQVKIQLYGENYKHPKLLVKNKIYGWFVIPRKSFNYDYNVNNLDVSKILDLHISSLIEDDEKTGIAYDEKQNPCTGIIVANSEHEFLSTMKNLFSDLVIVID